MSSASVSRSSSGRSRSWPSRGWSGWNRAGERSSGLAPSFAETFFARGVANFICTAWPVGDREARDFALTLYADLLGLTFNPPKEGPAMRIESRNYTPGKPQPMYRAMRNARRAIAKAG